MSKRLVSIILACVFLLSFSSAAEDAGNAEGKYNTPISILSALGIFDGKTDAATNTTRAEFVVGLVRLMGVFDVSPPDKSVFSDVPLDHSYAGEIMTAVGMGLINGYEDKSFRPEISVLLEDAVTMTVAALGYSNIANARGGYPLGYMLSAVEIGLLKGVSVSAGESLTNGEFALIIYNATQAKYMEQTSFGSLNTSTAANTVLEKYHSVKKITGVLNTNSKTSLEQGQGLSNGFVIIGEERFLAGSTNAEGYIGMDVTAYCKYSSEDDYARIIWIDLTQNRNIAVRVSGEDIVEFKRGLPSVLTYMNSSGKTISYFLRPSVSFITNGVIAQNYVDYILPDMEGFITLVDNNNDGDVDIVIVDLIENYVVSAVNVSNHIVYDRYSNKSLTIDPNEKKTRLRTIDGSEATFDSLAMWNVLTARISEDGLVKDVTVTTDSIDGTVAEISANNNIFTVLLESGETIKTAKSFGNGSVDILVGESYTFYFDDLGNVAAVQKRGTGGYEFGYLVQCAAKQGVSGGIEFLIFSSSGNQVVLEAESKVKIDGDIKSGEAIIDYLKADYYADENKMRPIYVLPGIIKYKTNSDDKIYEIDTAVCAGNEPTDSLQGGSPYPSVLTYKPNSRFFGLEEEDPATNTYKGTKVVLSSEAVLFSVPLPTSKLVGGIMVIDRESVNYTTIDKRFSVPPVSYLGNGAKHKVVSYRLTNPESKLTDDVILLDSDSVAAQNLDEHARLSMIKSITSALDEDDVPCKKITLLNEGAEKEILISDDLDLENVPVDGQSDFLRYRAEVGDLVRYGLNNSGRIEQLLLIYKAPTEAAPGRFLSGSNEQYFTILDLNCGKVMDLDGNVAKIRLVEADGVTTNENSKETLVNIIAHKIIICEMVRGKYQMSFGDTKDIDTYKNVGDACSTLITQISSGEPFAFALYK